MFFNKNRWDSFTQTTLFFAGIILFFGYNTKSSEEAKTIQDQLENLKIDLRAVQKTHKKISEKQAHKRVSLQMLAKRYNIGIEEARRLLVQKQQQAVAAAETGDLTTLRNLVSQGADVNYSDQTNFNWNPLTIAADKGKWAIVFSLVNNVLFPLDMNLEIDILAGPRHQSALGYAARNEHLQVTQSLLNAKADPNNPSDTPPLIESIIGSQRDYQGADDDDYIPLLLIKNGARINLKNKKSGKSPLMYALEHKKPNLANKLIELGADINEVDATGKTTLEYAKEYGYELPTHQKNTTHIL